jgi:large subunit ribosomal protein L4
MTLDIVNARNEKTGSLELSDELFGGRLRTELVWQSVVRDNAADRRGTHATKSRGMVSGTGKKPYKQKGTGRPQVGSLRTPLWRGGGTVFGPQPRSYEYAMPRKQERGALRQALASKLQSGAVVVVDAFAAVEKTKAAAGMLARFGAARSALVVDVKPADALVRAVRNIPGTVCLESGRLKARDVIRAQRIIATKAAVERLQEVLGS